MYKHVISIREGVPKEALKVLAAIANKAFNNRAGKVKNTSVSPYELIYEGGEDEYGCLDLGMLALEKEKEFLSCVSSWKWIDVDEPEESCDVLEELAIPVR